MKLCDIVQFHSPLSGGVKRYVNEKSLFFGKLPGIRHVIIVPGSRNRTEELGQTAVYEVQSPRLPFSQSYRALCSERRIAAIIDTEKPDIIEVGDPYRAAWIGIRQARRAGIPITAYYHSDYPRAYARSVHKYFGDAAAAIIAPLINRYLVNLYRQMDATIVASERLQQVLSKMGVEGIERIPPGIDTAVFSPSCDRGRIRSEIGVRENLPMLLYVGRLSREKNIARLIRTHELLSESMPCHLHLVGDGELRGMLKRHLRRQRHMTWLPYCADKGRLAEIYSAADLLIHPGTEETFGLVSVEAQACGLAVLGVRSGGIDETIPEAERVLMSRSSEPSDLAQSVRNFLRSANPISAAERRERVQKNFSVESTAERLLLLYRRLSENGKSGRNRA
jgi:alpha-1,6-mannosyltransferase